MKPAGPSDWKTEALPEQSTTLRLDRRFDARAMHSIRQGQIPAEMEEKWFVYWADDVLYFHRSWTGCCIYVVRFVADGEGWRMTEAQVNRDPEQYRETDDAADVRMISFLIDRLLLRGDVAPPDEGASEAEAALKSWSQVGRAMLGQHPTPPDDDDDPV